MPFRRKLCFERPVRALIRLQESAKPEVTRRLKREHESCSVLCFKFSEPAGSKSLNCRLNMQRKMREGSQTTLLG